MRTKILAGTVLSMLLACGGGGTSDAPAHEAFEGTWRVVNEEGVENGQTLEIRADTITLTTLGRPDESPASYTRAGDAVTVHYKGWDYTLKSEGDPKHARFDGKDGGGVHYGLVRD